MDGKAELIAAIDSPNGINEDDWLCLLPFIDELSPLWENFSCHHGMYYIPDKFKIQLKEILQHPDVVVTYPDVDRENDMSVAFDEETLPDHERTERSARHHYELATSAYDVGDFNTAFNEIEKCLELDSSPEYLSFSATIAFAIDTSLAKKTSVKVVEVKEIDVSTLRCGACNGPYHPATGHAFFVDVEFKGVACGICAGRYFAEKARRHGWRPQKLSKKQRRQQRKRDEAQRQKHFTNAQRIVAEARSSRFDADPDWTARFGPTLDV